MKPQKDKKIEEMLTSNKRYTIGHKAMRRRNYFREAFSKLHHSK